MQRLVRKLRSLKWAGVRLTFLSTSAVCMIFPPLGLVLSPYFSWFFFSSFNVPRHFKHAWKIYKWSWVFAAKYLRHSEQLCLSDFFSPPVSAPTDPRLKIVESWERGRHSCGECSRCCVMQHCVFLKGKGICLAYKSPFWNYFNCGRYPLSEKEIERYRCPKWIIQDQKSLRQSPPVHRQQ